LNRDCAAKTDAQLDEEVGLYDVYAALKISLSRRATIRSSPGCNIHTPIVISSGAAGA
jgi:hypothetical protein